MDWSCNILVVEKILCNLDLPDLLSAATVSKAWLTASAKAFEATSRVVIPDSRPEDSPNLSNFLQRFQRIKDFKFKLSGREATSNGLNCILADLPPEKLTTLTHLTLDYEPTAAVLEAINSFLAQLTSRFPTLKQLQICPNADPAEDLVAPSPEFLLDNLVPSAEHPNLRVLQVPVGPNSGSGIDWRFLTFLKKIEQLDLLKFHVRGRGRFVERQLTEFGKYFPAGAKISSLNLHLRLGIRKYLLEQPDLIAMTCAFRAINPETCTLYIEQVESDDYFLPCAHIRQYWWIVEYLISANLKRINVYNVMSLDAFTKDAATGAHVSTLLFPLQHGRQPHQNQHVLLRIDICSENGPPMSFIELECAQFNAPLLLRHGPVGDYAEAFACFLKSSLLNWTLPHPVPRYNALRKYTFDQSQRITGHQQFCAVQRSPNRPDIIFWREIDFITFPHSSSIINAQSSWKLPLKLKRPTREYQNLPVTTLLVYSID